MKESLREIKKHLYTFQECYCPVCKEKHVDLVSMTQEDTASRTLEGLVVSACESCEAKRLVDRHSLQVF